MEIRCIECDIILKERHWKAHQKMHEHFVNVQVNIVVRAMDNVGLKIERLVKVLEIRKKTDSKAGEFILAMNIGQKGTMRAQ